MILFIFVSVSFLKYAQQFLYFIHILGCFNRIKRCCTHFRKETKTKIKSIIHLPPSSISPVCIPYMYMYCKRGHITGCVVLDSTCNWVLVSTNEHTGCTCKNTMVCYSAESRYKMANHSLINFTHYELYLQVSYS